MEFGYEINERVLIVTLGKDVDHHNAENIRKKIDRIIDMNNIHTLVFDFQKTKFIDSSGIGVVMGRYKHMKNIGGKLGIVNINRNTNKLFKLSGIYNIVNNFTSVEEAISMLV